MFCPKCGKPVDENADVCLNCGKITSKQRDYFNEPKTLVGVLLALFFSFLGLIIGIAIYPEKTLAWETFISAWCYTFFASLFVTAVSCLIFLL